MSTILDALKKVEQEREADYTAAQQRQLEAMHPTADKRRRGVVGKGITGGLLFVMLFIMGGITFYLFRGNPAPPAPQAAAPSKDRPKSVTRPKKTIQTARAKSPQALPDKPLRFSMPRAGKPQPKVTQPTRSPAKKPQTQQTAINRAKKTPTENQPVKTTVIHQPPFGETEPVTDPVSTVAKSAPKEASAPQSEPTARSPVSVPRRTNTYQQPQQERSTSTAPSHSNIERLTDGSINVQAIAWSPIAEERIAVINSKIVHEGSSVDDYTLVTIGQDDIVVRKGGRSWRAVIGRP